MMARKEKHGDRSSGWSKWGAEHWGPGGREVWSSRAAMRQHCSAEGGDWPGVRGAVNGGETDFGWVGVKQLLLKGRFPQGQPAAGEQS